MSKKNKTKSKAKATKADPDLVPLSQMDKEKKEAKIRKGLEDKLRKKAVSPSTIREAFQLIAAADRVLSSVSTAGKQILTELGTPVEEPLKGPRAEGSEKTSARASAPAVKRAGEEPRGS